MRKQLQELHRTSRDRRHKIERELRDIDNRVANIVSAIAAGAFSEALKTELARLEDRKRVLQTDQDTLPGSDDVIALPGNYGQLYQDRVNKLAALFEAPEAGQAREHIRSLIDKIVVHPTRRGQSPEFEIHGSLAGILAFAYGKEESPGTCGSGASSPRIAVSMVAGARFELTTFRL